jgi:hypothetical protein
MIMLAGRPIVGPKLGGATADGSKLAPDNARRAAVRRANRRRTVRPMVTTEPADRLAPAPGKQACASLPRRMVCGRWPQVPGCNAQ